MNVRAFNCAREWLSMLWLELVAVDQVSIKSTLLASSAPRGIRAASKCACVEQRCRIS